MKIISQNKIQEIFNLLSQRRNLKAKTILEDLINSKDLEKMIDEDIEYQKKQLSGDVEKDKSINWRIIGFEAFKKKIQEIN